MPAKVRVNRSQATLPNSNAPSQLLESNEWSGSVHSASESTKSSDQLYSRRVELYHEDNRPPGRWINGRWVDGAKAFGTTRAGSENGWRRDLPVSWETSIYSFIFITALIMRLWDLGSRAVHHDESLHGFFSWKLYMGDGFIHNPLMHGTFLFEGTAAIFTLFGDNDFTLRLLPAIFGTCLILLPLLIRERLGNIGAITATTLLAISPALLYFSRFARNDIFMAVWTLALVAVMWRYLDERHTKWLYAAAALLAFGFATKETQFLVVAILAIALFSLSLGDIGRWLWGQRSLRDWGTSGSFLIMLTGLSLPMFGAVSAIAQDSLGITLAAPDGTPNIAPGQPEGAGLWIAGLIIGLLVIISASSLIRWQWKVGIRIFAIFWFLLLFMFTTIGSNPGGIGTGVWQSLGYWIAQQDVARGDQPWFYYLMTISVYEFLPWTVSIGAVIYYAVRGDQKPVWLSLALGSIAAVAVFGAIQLSPGGEKVHTDGTGIGLGLLVVALISLGVLLLTKVHAKSMFTRFLVYWAVATFIAYTVSAEKMPWLIVNITLPLIMLSGKAIGDVIATIEWKKMITRGAFFTIVAVPLFLVILWRLIFFSVKDAGPNIFVELFLLVAIEIALLVILFLMTRRLGSKQNFSFVLIALLGLMGILTFRAGWIATYVNGDEPRDMLIYTQTAPDIPKLMDEIENVGVLTLKRTNLNITIDASDGYTWPWAWYLRNYEKVGYPEYRTAGSPQIPPDSAIVVVNAKNNLALAEVLEESFTEGRQLVHRWWFPEDYKKITSGEFFETFVDRNRWRTSVDFFLYRKLPNPIGGVDSYVYFDKNIPFQPVK